jgi:hypothetical protein
VWDELASIVERDVVGGDVNIAKVDCTTSEETCSRFGVPGYPTLKLFREGTMYEYRGPRDAEDMFIFAVEGYATSKFPKAPVPPIPTALGKIVGKTKELIETLTEWAELVWYNDPAHKLPRIYILMGGLVIGSVIAMICMATAFFCFGWGSAPQPVSSSSVRKKKKVGTKAE